MVSMIFLILWQFRLLTAYKYRKCPWVHHEKRKEARSSFDIGRLLPQCSGATGFYRKVPFKTRLLLWKRLQALPLSKILKIEGIFLK
jgi:hypothetical protein